jgi:UDP:flavonoid glycosyltransferase YjiC (YdhE family)
MMHSGLRRGVRTYNAILAAEGLQPVAVSEWFEIPHRCARRFFQTGVPTLDFSRNDLPPNVTFVGPLLPPAKGIPQEMTHRLREHPGPVVAVSQGTVDNDDPDKLIVPSLEAFGAGPYLVVATTGGSHTSELRNRYPQENVIIEDFLDFGALFQNVDVFICNGGYGSVMSALLQGIPVLSAGKREGKNDVNARLDHLGHGIDLRTERPSPKQVADGVARILNDHRLAENVTAVRDELRAYRPIEIIDRCLVEDGIQPPRSPS